MPPADSPPGVDEFHITIASLSMDGDGLSVQRDVEMAKSALLYADRVTLASPKAIFVASAATLAYGSDHDQNATILALVDEVGGEDFGALYKSLKGKRNRTLAETRTLAKIESALASASANMTETLGPSVEDSQFDELMPAVEAGLLDVDPLGTHELTSADDFIDEVLVSLRDLLKETVSPNAAAHPMYDDAAGDLLKAMLRENQVEDAVFDLANEVGVARDLIDTVEAFPAAPMDAILDVRERLREPLIRFRAAVADASAEIGAEESVLGEHFQVRVAEIYRRTVAPELQLIRDGLHELKALPTLRRIARSTAGPAVRAGTSTGLALLSGHTDAVDLALIAAAAGTSAKAVLEESEVRTQIEREQKRNRFFWLFEANRTLSA